MPGYLWIRREVLEGGAEITPDYRCEAVRDIRLRIWEGSSSSSDRLATVVT
eukprot:IDg1194t1